MHNQYTIGVDIGATKILSGIIRGGKLIHTYRLLTQTSQNSKKELLAKIKSAIEKVWDPKVKGIGLGLAGVVNVKDKIFLNGANFPSSFKNVHIAKELANFHVPIELDNDVHCFTLGEALFGSGKGYKNVFGLTLGTGVGGALVIDGKIYRGRNNAAGEIGHTIITSNTDKRCGCGRSGHLEAFISGKSLNQSIRKHYSQPFPTEEIEIRASQGDAIARAILAEAGQAFAVGIANVIHSFNPDVVVVGGGLSDMRIFWDVLKRDLKGLIAYSQLTSTPVRKSKLKNGAGVLGASALITK